MLRRLPVRAARKAFLRPSLSTWWSSAEHAGLRQFWAGLGRSHQGVGAVSTSFQPFFCGRGWMWVGCYCIIKQMVFEGFLFYFCVFFIPKIIGLDVLRLFWFTLSIHIKTPNSPDVTRFSSHYPILQHGPSISAAAIPQVKELHPCHNLRALHVRWVRRLGQAWATNWNFKNILSSKNH